MNEYLLFAIAIIPILWLIVSLGALKLPALFTYNLAIET